GFLYAKDLVIIFFGCGGHELVISTQQLASFITCHPERRKPFAREWLQVEGPRVRVSHSRPRRKFNPRCRDLNVLSGSCPPTHACGPSTPEELRFTKFL